MDYINTCTSIRVQAPKLGEYPQLHCIFLFGFKTGLFSRIHTIEQLSEMVKGDDSAFFYQDVMAIQIAKKRQSVHEYDCLRPKRHGIK